MDKIRDLFRLAKENTSLLKKVALPAVVLLAVVLFWTLGGEEELVIETEAEGTSVEESVIEPADGSIYIDIGGEVSCPGVYKVNQGTRLFQVIEKAGGLKETADTDSINQAEPVTDGQKIIIGSLDEESPYYTGQKGYTYSSGGGETPGREMAVRETAYGTIININLATLDELQLLPGVGPSTARKILDYRNENGEFQSAEDLKNISGIGEKTYDNLKDYIEV